MTDPTNLSDLLQQLTELKTTVGNLRQSNSDLISTNRSLKQEIDQLHRRIHQLQVGEPFRICIERPMEFGS